MALLLAYTHLYTAGDVENGHFRTPTTELYQALLKRDRGNDEESEACYGVSLVMAQITPITTIASAATKSALSASFSLHLMQS